jgi:hypothetical protein
MATQRDHQTFGIAMLQEDFAAVHKLRREMGLTISTIGRLLLFAVLDNPEQSRKWLEDHLSYDTPNKLDKQRRSRKPIPWFTEGK